MIKINLLPSEKKLFGPIQQEAVLLASVAVLIIVLAGLVSAYESRKIADVRKSIGMLEKELIRLNEITKSVDKLERDKALLVQQMSIIRKIAANRNMWPMFFDDLTQKLPDGVWLVNLAQDNERSVVIDGFSWTNLLLVKFMQGLEASSFIQRIELSYAQKVVQDEEDAVRFQVVLTLRQGM